MRFSGFKVLAGQPSSKQSGDAAEDIALRHLQQAGLRLLVRNYRTPGRGGGEIDLVMRDGSEIAFIEVKTRRGDAAGRAEESVSVSKGRKLLASGSWYLQQHPAFGDPIWRIDLVAITLSRDGAVVRFNHIVNAVVSS